MISTRSKITHKIYVSLLDGFQSYLDSDEIYQEYWGFSENPEKTEEQFAQEQYQSLIDRINRVPFESEAADRGTAFNEVVDCIIENRTSTKMELKSDETTISALYKGKVYTFPKAATVLFAREFAGALTQYYTESALHTKYGDVLLYGYIDCLLPTTCNDIKTTSRYKFGKFRKSWQRIVYPYCLNKEGNIIRDFIFNVVAFNSSGFSTYTEHYTYTERDEEALTSFVERFIEFLQDNRDKITDKKIFNL